MKPVCIDSRYSSTRILTARPPQPGQESPETLNSIQTANKARKDEGGLRLKGWLKHGYKRIDKHWFIRESNYLTDEAINLNLNHDGNELPLISIITVVFNGKYCLEETIQDVIHQTYPNIEYIVVDGGSTDGTLDIIHKYENVIDYWVSEKDAGIYDAMNKGIDLASGKWINFMNAGDTFYSRDVITDLFNTNEHPESVIYGHVHVRYDEGFSKIKKVGKLSRLWLGMQFCHQSALIQTDYHKENKYNIKNKIAADLEFFYKLYKNDATFKYMDVIISSVTAGGVSDTNRIKTIIASKEAISKHKNKLMVNIAYSLILLNIIIRSLFRKILPKELTKIFIRANI